MSFKSLGGVPAYHTTEATVTVGVPINHPTCNCCIKWCKYEPNYYRHSCRITGELLFDIEHTIGELCPLRKEISNENAKTAKG